MELEAEAKNILLLPYQLSYAPLSVLINMFLWSIEKHNYFQNDDVFPFKRTQNNKHLRCHSNSF